MFAKIVIQAGLCFIFGTTLNAQSPEVIHNRIIDALASSSESDEQTDLQTVIENLEKLKADPVNINTASADELRTLPFLSEFEITGIISYREEYGPFLTVYELQLVHGLEVSTAQMMLPYITTGDAGGMAIKTTSGKPEGDILLSAYRVLQKSDGYSAGSTGSAPAFEGNPWRLSARVTVGKGRMAGGITMEKDPGEGFFAGSNRKGFDFYSANVNLEDAGIIEMFVAGDYRLQFGQGLTLWNGFSPGKSSIPLNIIKRPGLLKPYSSNDEDNFFRGMAVNFTRGNANITLFASYRHKDASVCDTLENGEPVFTSFIRTGYHRTRNEIIRRHTIPEKMVGTGFNYSGSFFRIGAVLTTYSFGGFMLDNDEIYEANDFSGSSLLNAGADYTVSIGMVKAAGEISYGNDAFANINSIVLNTGKFASVALSYRHYPARFYSLYSSALSESSENRNESGFYLGTVLHPARRLTLSAYADFYRFPWMKYNTTGPSSGSEYLVSADFNSGGNIDMSARLKFSGKDAGTVYEDDDEYNEEQVYYRGVRYDFSYDGLADFTLKSRAEYVNTGKGESRGSGYMVFQDIKYVLPARGISVRAGYAYFSTDDYSSRIYIYEPQTVSSFSATSLYGRGHRSYFMLQYDITEKISFWIRFSGTCYSDRNSTGSGYSRIDSGEKHDIRFQVKARF